MPDSETEISRVTRTKAEARATYDRMAKWYDLVAGRFEGPLRVAALNKLRTAEGEIVLEIGFGTGQGILALAQAVGASGKVFGIDISPGMCEISREKLAQAGLSDRAVLKCGDAADLPFEAGQFDAVLMSFTLELFDTPEIPTVLGECRRVLRGNGRMGILAMSNTRQDSRMAKLYEWAHVRFPAWVDCRPIFARKVLEEAGFRILEVTEMTMCGLPVEIVLANKE
jgi:ubiquinone/menaquinone biosynthesis C-methylase UbiE